MTNSVVAIIECLLSVYILVGLTLGLDERTNGNFRGCTKSLLGVAYGRGY